LRGARAAARLAPEFAPKMAATVRENLRLAFGHTDPALVRGIYRHFSQAAVDLLWFRRLFDPARSEQHFHWAGDGLEHYRAHGGDGAIIVAGHFGNWELYNAAFHAQGFPLSVVARELDTARAASWIRSFRQEYSADVIAKDAVARKSVRVLRGGGRLTMLVDQAAGRHGIPAPFFGRDVSTFPTPAALAHRFGVPVYAAYSTRLGDGISYRCFLEHVELAPEVDAATAQLNRILEGYVRAAPEQWWWFHRRFKPRRNELVNVPVSAAGVPLTQ
jgi:KDO2-lipid IV(A) lauroyltransferase